MKVIDKQDRKVLCEGRNCGLAFGFLKETKDGEFSAVNALSPCKDYLNDVVYAEQYKQKVQACGLDYKPQGGVFGDKKFYLGMKVLGYQNGSKHISYDKDVKDIDDNYKNIQKLLNWVEGELGIHGTKIHKANDGYYVLEAPSYWSDHVPLTSLYTLIVRVGQEYDGKQSPKEYLNSYGTVKPDGWMWSGVKPKLSLILKGQPVKRTYDEKTGGSIHNAGIHAYNSFDL